MIEDRREVTCWIKILRGEPADSSEQPWGIAKSTGWWADEQITATADLAQELQRLAEELPMIVAKRREGG